MCWGLRAVSFAPLLAILSLASLGLGGVMLGWQGWCPHSWLSVRCPAGEGEASTRSLCALCASLGLDSDCSLSWAPVGAVVLSSSLCCIMCFSKDLDAFFLFAGCLALRLSLYTCLCLHAAYVGVSGFGS